MTGDARTPVFLLKTPSSPKDSYEELLRSVESLPLDPLFVPVLQHVFRDDAIRVLRRHAERFAFAGGSEATLRQKATNNPSKRYGGLVFTSQRAVDAFGYVIQNLRGENLSSLFDKDMPIYVVGKATAKGVAALQLPCAIVGSESGNGEALANFILRHHKTVSRQATHLNETQLPLLFLTGEQRRDTIPRTLMSEALHACDRIPVQELVAYETGEMAEFEETFATHLEMENLKEQRLRVVVVFSPQGCEGMLSALGWLDNAGKFNLDKRARSESESTTHVITIGPTTRDHLIATFGFEPSRSSADPTPEGVLKAIQSCLCISA